MLGVGFSVTNSWWGISAGLIAGVNSGGPGESETDNVRLKLSSCTIEHSPHYIWNNPHRRYFNWRWHLARRTRKRDAQLRGTILLDWTTRTTPLCTFSLLLDRSCRLGWSCLHQCQRLPQLGKLPRWDVRSRTP